MGFNFNQLKFIYKMGTSSPQIGFSHHGGFLLIKGDGLYETSKSVMIHCQKEGFVHLSEIALRPPLSTLPLDVRTIKSCVLCPTSGMVQYGNLALPCHPQIVQNELFFNHPPIRSRGSSARITSNHDHGRSYKLVCKPC